MLCKQDRTILDLFDKNRHFVDLHVPYNLSLSKSRNNLYLFSTTLFLVLELPSFHIPVSIESKRISASWWVSIYFAPYNPFSRSRYVACLSLLYCYSHGIFLVPLLRCKSSYSGSFSRIAALWNRHPRRFADHYNLNQFVSRINLIFPKYLHKLYLLLCNTLR